ncbi:MAG: DUF4065 domain-containing protein [Saprospiraceae bacterium]|nr:DUF4065 domain-containing protein [Saprospiraceae bacterium]
MEFGILDHSLFHDAPEAWSNGPVYRIIWDEYKINYQRHEHIVFNSTYDLENEYKSRTSNLQLNDDQLELLHSILKKIWSTLFWLFSFPYSFRTAVE